ncbi:UDP-N-acetylglucosamine-transferase [bacterium]|nr:UDP-N-acetylglucosamine-transferase [bacterium]
MAKNGKIFIQIASYRDPELINTLDDCIDKADKPENLVFGICWQHSDEDEWDNIDKYKDDKRFKIVDVNYEDSKGACWARNTLQQQYTNEEYTLQLDSHHRFTEGWDTELIKMLKGLQKKGHKKPLLTSYISSYNPENDPEGRVKVPWLMNFDRFIPEGAVFFLPATIPGWKDMTEPIPGRFYSAHFAFSLGSFVKEVPHDPEYYFHGEEISIAVRAFTHGYDLFHPHKIIAWHEYTRKGRTKQWDDDKTWGDRNTNSHLRNRKLFEMDGLEKDIDFGIYDFGTERTLEDYERYAGVNFKKRSVQEYTKKNNFAPNPPLYGEEYESSWTRTFKHCINLHRSSVSEKDYSFWAVIFEDEDGTPIHREDLNKQQIDTYLNGSNDTFNIWKEFDTVRQPQKWIVWPHSESKGWLEKIEGKL